MEKMNIVDKLEDLHQRVITNETTARLSRKNEELQTENDALVNAISLMEISNHGNADIVLSKQANRAVTLRELLLVIKSLAKGTDGHEADIERVRVQLTSEYEAKLAEASARENELRQQLVARAKTQSTMEAKVASLQQQLAEKEAELSEQRKTMQNEAAQRKSLAAKIAAARKENVSLGQKVCNIDGLGTICMLLTTLFAMPVACRSGFVVAAATIRRSEANRGWLPSLMLVVVAPRTIRPHHVRAELSVRRTSWRASKQASSPISKRALPLRPPRFVRSLAQQIGAGDIAKAN